MRVALYARVSTRDQDPQSQLLALREYAAGRGWDAEEFVDCAPAGQWARRGEWSRCMAQAARHRLDLLLVWRMDRAFRSVLDAAITLERLRGWGVGLRSLGEPWLDTTSPFGEALYHITIAYAQLERGILSERTKAGMERARRQGKHIGRPQARVAPATLEQARAMLAQGVPLARVAREVDVPRTTLARHLAEKGWAS